MPFSEDAQSASNQLVDEAQKFANSVVDLGEHAAVTLLDGAITSIGLIARSLETLKEKLVADEATRGDQPAQPA